MSYSATDKFMMSPKNHFQANNHPMRASHSVSRKSSGGMGIGGMSDLTFSGVG